MQNQGIGTGAAARVVCAVLLAVGGASAQLSTSAYRVIGQPDFRNNGLNMVQGTELNLPGGIALDPRDGRTHIYIADSGNSRILGWDDVNAYQIGDPPAVVLGQPGPQYTAQLGIGSKGFSGLAGIAVNPMTGNLYAADVTNNRILVFASPFAKTTRVEPDAVIGQADFTTKTAGTTSGSLNQPRGVAFDSAGNLWVADSGNHRVLRYSAAALNTLQPAADMVIGQRDFVSGNSNAGGTISASGFDTPVALAFDSHDNLYVADFNNTRVLRFSAPLSPSNPNTAASAVFGESNFASRGVPQQPSGATLAGPMGLSVDANDRLYVAVPFDNRVLVFASAPGAGSTATFVLGQTDMGTTTANTGASPLASPSTLARPSDVKVDANGSVFVCDSGNHRVLQFPAGAKSAIRLWGQSDFVSNTVNQLKPGSINYPYKIAIDYSSSPFALYVSDTGNNRVLVWKDSVRYRSGDPADLVIGQPNLRTGAANVDSPGGTKPTATSLFAPEGLAVNPYDGTLYVADAGNNRVLRYPRPVAQGGRITPDAVIGQSDFLTADSAAVTAATLKNPAGLAIGPAGNLFIADSGNNRVVEYAAGAGTGAAAIRVFGQPLLTSSVKPTRVSAQTLAVPQGIAVDPAGNLYVADAGANRVLIFPDTQSAPLAGMPATFVLGQPNFESAAAASLKTPADVAVDSAGKIYVADRGNNRVLIFDSLVFLPLSGAAPAAIVGQPAPNGTAPNWDSADGLAGAAGLYGPAGIYLDRQDTLYVGDAGNNRVVQFLRAGAVVNAATYQAGAPIGQGSLATLFGSNLASDTAAAGAAPWPGALLNRQVVVNDDLVSSLYFAGADQINFQLPSNAPVGAARVAVRLADTGELVAGGPVIVAAASPGLFTANQSGSGQAVALNQDFTINGPNNPARAGSTIVLYGTGQGQVSPAVPDGAGAPASPLAQTVAVPTSNGSTCLNSQPSVCVAVGGTGFGGIQYSGLAPGFVGLWQINVTIPAGTPAGNVPVRVIINGRPSNTVTVAVRQ